MTKTSKFMKLVLGLLSFSLILGILANLVVPKNLSATCFIIILALVSFFFLPQLRTWTNRLSPEQIQKIIYLSLALILGIQVSILYFMPATVYHDPFRVLSQAEVLSTGDTHWQYSTYFWRYSNNVALTAMLAKWFMFTNLIHLSTNTALHILALLFLDTFILLSLKFIVEVGKKNSLGITAFFIFSPWAYTYYLQVFYSDLPILCTLLICLIILKKWPTFSKKQRWLNGFILWIAVLFGQLVKPNLIVFAIAVLIVGGTLWLKHRKTHHYLLVPLTVILLGFTLATPLKVQLAHAVNFVPNTRYELPATHWIWMSYDPKGSGMYKGKDVVKMMNLPNKNRRQKYLNHALPQRLETLGPLGLVKRWVQKAAILLNVSDISTAYTSGFIEAPSIYQKIQPFMMQYGNIVMRFCFIFIYGLSLMGCFSLLRMPKIPYEPILNLALISAVGYVAFHTLVWETESRYGQSLLPLLLVVCACTAGLYQPAAARIKNIRFNHLQTAASLGVLLSVIALISGFSWQTPKTQDVIVAAQKSQLSAQYAAKWQEIGPHSVVTQGVNLNHAANYFSVSVLPEAQLEIRLVNLNTNNHYCLKPGSTIFKYRGHLPKGRYQIVLKNRVLKTQPIKTVQTKRYELTPHPLKIDGETWQHTSLLYIAVDKI